MYAKRIIPCLDVNEGRVVKGTSFVNLRDAGDPVACAEAYDAQQADELVLLDITASAQARGTQLSYVQSVAERIFGFFISTISSTFEMWMPTFEPPRQRGIAAFTSTMMCFARAHIAAMPVADGPKLK